MKIKQNSIPQKNKDILFRKEKDKVIMLNEKSGEPYYLQNSGSFIWEKINGERTVNEILAILIQHYSGDEKEIKHDLLVFLEELHENNLIIIPGLK